MTTYIVGDLIRVSGEFRTPAGVLTDPTDVDVIARSPARRITTTAATKDSTGIYHADVSVTEPGPWAFQMAGTGAVAKSAIVRIEVEEGLA